MDWFLHDNGLRREKVKNSIAAISLSESTYGPNV